MSGAAPVPKGSRDPARAIVVADDLWCQLGLDDPTLLVQNGVINGKKVDAEDGKTFNVEGESRGAGEVVTR